MAQLGTMQRKVVVGVVVLVVVVASGLAWSLHHAETGQRPTIAVQSPVSTTEAWFAAVNAHNMPLAQAHFAPAARDQMAWSSWGQPFTDLHCSLTKKRPSWAAVICTFATQNDPSSGMSNVDFFTVELIHESSGRWLITNYGQG
jgi:hypothetical protein